ncbi:MAG: hypothetical protein PHU51_04570 [Candidatus Nanoarchaeia archaeon]|nr:hypothetical protein [Candidatus Nanoarchaeia archaeon]
MGIRDIALSKGAKAPKYLETEYIDSVYPETYQASFDRNYNAFTSKNHKSYLPDVKNPTEATEIIKIEIEIGYAEIGVHADVENPNYDFSKALSEAEDIAMKRLMDLCGEDVKLRYRVDIAIEDWVDVLAATVTLTKAKSKK